MNVRRLALSTGLALGLLGSNAAYALQEATPAVEPAGGPPLPEGCSVIAEGLLNPRYVAVGDDGTIYVTEAGVGGDEMVSPPVGPVGTPEAGATPVAEEAAEQEMFGPPMRGMSGQVTAISPDGSQSVVASGLPSYAMGIEVTGPAGIAVADGQLIVAVGGAGPATAFTEALPNENAVVSIDPATGETVQLADIATLERVNNPDPFAVDSNLYGIEVAADGWIYVNDAGGNTTYRVPVGGGQPEVVVVHPGIEIPADQAPPGGNPFREGANELDPVPTDLVTGADGLMLSGLLSGGPFPPGAAKIVGISPDGTLSDVGVGLTMVVGLAVGPDGHLYATQFSMNLLGEMPEPGNVVRVLADGSHEVVLDGLMLPNGIAFDQDGSMLVVTNAVSMGPPSGQLLRCEGVAQAADASEVITVTLDDMFYSPADITIPANTDVTLRIVNKGYATHDFAIDQLGIASEVLAGGGTTELKLNLPAGDYSFGCRVPGHKFAGMTGVLHVK